MAEPPTDFIRQQIDRDIAKPDGSKDVITRFPPEPNGYLHIGHAKSICLNFGIAEEYGGHAYLRFDDTNPLAESDEYVEAIKRDVAWLGFDMADRVTFASDYFEVLYNSALELIRKGKAFVCSLSQDEIRATRGTLTEPGTDSPHRNRPVDESLDLFARMRAGEFADGAHVLRARIDMASPNLNMRDPVLYRIRHAAHHNVGEAWVIYPTYDFTHCICDALENITHSLCTLEFEDHRPLYDWVLDHLSLNARPRQIEFSRLGLEHTVMSKRLLQRLVAEGVVEGWDDPRLPTLAGLRRRGVTPGAIRDFCRRAGVTKQGTISWRSNCWSSAFAATWRTQRPRALGVVKPLKVRLTNYAEAEQTLAAPWHQRQPEMGARPLPFGPELYIDRDDFTFSPPRKWKRLSPGAHVRLRYAYIIRCDEVITDADGEVSELRCAYLPDSKSGSDTSGVKPAGVIHWVAAHAAEPVQLRLYDRLFRGAQSKGRLLDGGRQPGLPRDGLRLPRTRRRNGRAIPLSVRARWLLPPGSGAAPHLQPDSVPKGLLAAPTGVQGQGRLDSVELRAMALDSGNVAQPGLTLPRIEADVVAGQGARQVAAALLKVGQHLGTAVDVLLGVAQVARAAEVRPVAGLDLRRADGPRRRAGLLAEGAFRKHEAG